MVVTLCFQAHQWLVFRAVWFDSKLLIKDESIKTPLSRARVAFPNLKNFGPNETFDGIIWETTQWNSSALNNPIRDAFKKKKVHMEGNLPFLFSPPPP